MGLPLKRGAGMSRDRHQERARLSQSRGMSGVHVTSTGSLREAKQMRDEAAKPLGKQRDRLACGGMDIPALSVGTDPDTGSKVGSEGTLLLDRQCKQLLGNPNRVMGAG